MLALNKYKICVILSIILIGVCLFAFIPTSNIDLRISKKVVAEWGISLFVILAFIKNPWLKAFLIWALIRVMFTFATTSYTDFVTLMFFVLFYQAVKDRLKVNYFNAVLNGICIIGLIHIVVVILQYLNWWIIVIPQGSVVTHTYFHKLVINLKPQVCKFGDPHCGFFGNIGDTSYFLALIFPAFFRRKWWWGIPIIGLFILLTNTLAGIIGAFITVLYFILFCLKKYRYQLAVLWVTLGVYLFQLKHTFAELITFNGRLFIWKDIFNTIIVKRPVMGVGLGRFRTVYPKVQSVVSMLGNQFEKYSQAHNEYLQIWAELGTIGLIIITGYIACLIIKGIRAKSYTQKILFSAILSTLAMSFVNFTFHLNIVLLALIYLAMFEKGGIDERRI